MLLRDDSIKLKIIFTDNAVSNPNRKQKNDKKKKSQETEIDNKLIIS
jgi:hypothetical protein